MNVLVSGHGADRTSLDAARRLSVYQRLLLLSSDASSRDLDTLRENESLAGVSVEVVEVDGHDLLACLSSAKALLARHRHDRVTVHVAGGPNLLTSALLLAAFEEGREAFYCHARGVSRLPVATEVRLEDRLGPEERDVLLSLPETGATPLDAVEVPGRSPASVKAALLRLRKAGLVTTADAAVRLTSTGAHYRRHLATAPEARA